MKRLIQALKHNSGFNEDHVYTARYTKQFRWTARIVFLILLTIFSIFALMAIWTFYPYQDNFVSGDSTIQTGKRTSSGIPVVTAGEPFRFEQRICLGDDGLSLSVQREAFLYERESAETENPVLIFGLAPMTILVEPNFCTEMQISLELPSDLPSGFIYSVRTVYSYKANPIRTIQDSFETEKFILLDSEKS